MAAQGIAIPIIGVVIGVIAFLGQFIAPLRNLVDQQTLKFFPNSIPDMNTLLQGHALNRIDKSMVHDALNKLGYNKEWISELLNSAKKKLGASEYTTLHRRGKIDHDTFLTQMQHIGLDTKQSEWFLKSMEYFPSAIDLVRFAVREVYTPDVAEKFQLFSDLPEKFISEAKKAGLPEEQAKNYWASHWDLPSPAMGFEMFQRRIIDFETLQLLLRSLDIMPFWRDKLTEMSYNPLTRVDVRRMYRIGVLDTEKVYNAYLDVGYSPENAKLMTEFTVQYENRESDGLTRSKLIDAYKKSIISEEQLREYLHALRLSEDVVDFYTEMAIYEKTQDKIELHTNDLIEQYRLGILDISQFRNELLKRDLPATYIETIITDILTLKGSKTKLPTQEDLQKWLKMGVIDELYYVAKMRLRGYLDEDIEGYLTEISLERNTSDRTFLNIEVYNRWVQNGIISKDRYIETLTAMGISIEDIQSNLSDLGVQ